MTFTVSGNITSTGSVYNELNFTGTFMDDDVRALYVDWDDGPSNKLSEANYQWVQFTEPVSTWTGSHTFTATGAYFYPVLRTINSQGIASRFYSYNDTSADVTPQTTWTGGMPRIQIDDGEATGIMRIENRTVKSGIDNSIFEKEGAKALYLFAPPIITSTQLNSINSVTVEVECIVDYSMVATGTAATGIGGAGSSLVTLSKTLSAASLSGASGMNVFTSTGGLVSKVLKITYKNPKVDGGSLDYDTNDAFNYLKLFVCVQGDDADYYPIGYVSSGCPIKKANDPLRNVVFDFSQSRAAASNVDLKNYRYDIGKVYFNPANQWSTTGTYFFSDNTVQTSPTKTVAYTYMTRPDGLNGQASVAYSGFTTGGGSDWARDAANQEFRTDQFIIDDFGRFAPQYHLTRMSVEPSSASSSTDSEVSSIIANQPDVYRITPAGLSTMSNVTSGSFTKIDIAPVASGNYTADYTAAAVQNGSSNLVSLSGCNTQTFNDIAGNTREANEYVLLLWDSKTNMVGFNINNYANTLINKTLSGTAVTDAERYTIAGVSYLAIDDKAVYGTDTSSKQHAYWKEVEFEDTTKAQLELRNTSGDGSYDNETNSLSQSGYVSFDMPLDWDSVKLEELCGGQFDATTATQTTDLLITGNAITNVGATASSEFGGVLKVDTLTGEALSALGTADDIGAFKYIALCTDPGGASNIDERPLWVASGTSNGTNAGLDDLYLTYGEDVGSDYVPTNLVGASNAKFLIRRVNIYDVIDGVSKVERQGSSNVKLTPVDAEISAFPNKYIVSNTSSGVGSALKTAWSGNAKYAMRIALSGSGTADGAGSSIKSFPEIWNIFDATEGNVSYVKEIDDSAYNLNSLPITSDFAVTYAGNYYQAITRKGRVFISKTGLPIQTLNFGSVALGDESAAAATQFASGAPASTYGHLHKARMLQANAVRVYWDEPQKDGTFVRFWGVVNNLAENATSGGPRRITSYSFDVTVEEIALLDNNGTLMTDIFPLGGIVDERDFT